MIRRVRVALKHSRPIYAEDVPSLMPSLLGAPTNRYRLFVLLLSLFFLYTWNGQKQSHAEEIRLRDERISSLQQDRDSVAEKLRVIWMHKKKIEAIVSAQKADADKVLSKVKLKESEVYGWKTKNEKCLKELALCENSKSDVKVEKVDNRQVIRLKKQVEEVEEKLKEREHEAVARENHLEEELKRCESKIKQLTGESPVKADDVGWHDQLLYEGMKALEYMLLAVDRRFWNEVGSVTTLAHIVTDL
ncbi:unnamed protein product [Caenorhabditis sp. 36 PRJEB53466]|nr:unnamed protein product [Caenorhabditis sp. 36 PRJEB53466]